MPERNIVKLIQPANVEDQLKSCVLGFVICGPGRPERERKLETILSSVAELRCIFSPGRRPTRFGCGAVCAPVPRGEKPSLCRDKNEMEDSGQDGSLVAAIHGNGRQDVER